MDIKNIPVLRDIDFSDPAKRKRSILICVAGAGMALMLILLIAKNISASPKEEVPEQTTYQSLEVPLGADKDKLQGKTIRDVSASRRTENTAEDLIKDTSASEDLMADLTGQTESASGSVSTPGNALQNLITDPSKSFGRQNVYPETKKDDSRSEAKGNNRQDSDSPAAVAARDNKPSSNSSSADQPSSSSRPDVEARRRRIYESYGYDPATGKPVAQAASSTTSTQPSGNIQSPAAPENKTEEPAIEPVKVQVRRSGGVSSFGSSGTELSNLGEQDEFVTDDPSHPFKAKFAYDEKVSSGQRVTIRLCEDMVVDGVLIPVNTHIFATCTVGERLKLNISSIDINGKIYTLNYTAYDNDGLEGLYCPQSENGKVAERLGEEAGQIAQSAIQSAITGYPSRIFQGGASAVRSKSGKVTVSVTAGYTFYLMKSR